MRFLKGGGAGQGMADQTQIPSSSLNPSTSPVGFLQICQNEWIHKRTVASTHLKIERKGDKWGKISTDFT